MFKSDRICGIEVSGNTWKLFVLSVYMHQKLCYIYEFNDVLDELESAVFRSIRQGYVILIGDWNAHFGPQNGSKG